ncbi:DUF3888 domain-containing protein [Paenibacillus chartarius]|uniref:DUF3888 domain-containing protein n=1 Tax=Paenibacillus chartarius TaxID=747481 RepID=A0ABV6DU88_9BACL
MKKHFIAGAMFGALLMATSSVFASSVIEATIFPSKVTFFLADGLSKEVQLQEGEEVLNYNNQAYVPLRLFAESSGALVKYTQASPETDNKNKIDVHFASEGDPLTKASNAAGTKPLEDSRELQQQDMLVSLLLPHMKEKLDEVYADFISIPPVVHPDSVYVKNIERAAAFRGFDFLITINAQPIVGPHIPVGEDLLTYRISPAGVELQHYEHLRGPDKDDFLPNYQNLLK